MKLIVALSYKNSIVFPIDLAKYRVQQPDVFRKLICEKFTRAASTKKIEFRGGLWGNIFCLPKHTEVDKK